MTLWTAAAWTSTAWTAPPNTSDPLRLQCATGSQPQLLAESLDAFEQLISAPRRRWLSCVDGSGRADGPGLQLRPSTSDGLVRMIGAGPWRAPQIAAYGMMRGGLPSGRWTWLAPDGLIIATDTLDETGSGDWRERDESGAVRAVGRLLRGRRHGLWRWQGADGRPRGEARYDEGALEGIATQFGAEAALELQLQFRQGRRHGAFTSYWPSGYKRWEGSYDDELREGSWCAFGERGQLLGCNSLRRGSGDWAEWAQSGALIAAGPLVGDRRHGVWQSWYEEGALQDVTRYAEGRLMHTDLRRYGPDGQSHRGAVYGLGVGGGGSSFAGGAIGGPLRNSLQGRVGGLGRAGLLARQGQPQVAPQVPPPVALGAARAARITLVGVRPSPGGDSPLPPVAATAAGLQASLATCLPPNALPGSRLRARVPMRMTPSGALQGPVGPPFEVAEVAPDGRSGNQAALAVWARCSATRLRGLRFAPGAPGPIVINVDAEVL